MMSRLRAAVPMVVVCLLGGTAAEGRKAYEWPSNLDLLREALGDAVGGLVAGLPDSVERTAVSVQPDQTAVRAQLVRSALVQTHLKRGVVVLSDRAAGSAIEIAIRGLDVTIPATRRSWLVGPRWAIREAHVALTASLRTSYGMTVWAADSERRTSDSVPVSALPWCAGPPELGLAPEVPETPQARIAEPVLIMSSVAAVIYLFFTQ